MIKIREVATYKCFFEHMRAYAYNPVNRMSDAEKTQEPPPDNKKIPDLLDDEEPRFDVIIVHSNLGAAMRGAIDLSHLISK
jgi:hypothetical protein